MNKETIGWIDIIFKMYKQSHPHGSEIVKDASSRTEVRERLLDYFNRLEEVHKRVAESKSKTGENMLKNFYYDLYVIKPENIPEAYFQNQVRIARERGMGNITLTEEDRKRYADAAIEDQKLTLDKWIEYFLYDDESKSYEMWEKYWVFQGLQSLGKYDKETKKFAKRDDTTVYPFPPVEKEYIFTTIHLMEEYIKSKTGDEEIKAALGNADFKQIYEYVIKQSMLKGECKSKTIEGKWVKYEQGSDYHVLRDSLQGYYTGWCTAAGESFARDQLAGGDFYVYYSLDENGDAKVPRIAIRMDGKNKIGEIRGIADGQNMESEMMPILNKKLDEFPDKDNYLKKVHDMDLLTLIDKKTSHGKELSLDEIRFLYEIDGKIIGFGYKKDPRINEIKQKRNKVKDYNLVFKYNKEFNGDLDLRDLTSAEGLDLTGVNIKGTLNLSGLTSPKGLDLSGVNIGGSLVLRGLKSAEDLDLSGVNIGRDLYLSGLTSPEGLDLSGVNIGGYLDLSGLTSAEGLKLPYNFELYKLHCNNDIKEEIRNNHDKYFAKPPVEEELNEAAAQKFNDETETLIINGNGDKKVAYVKKYDGTVEKIPYSKNMDKFISEQKAAMERGESSRFFEISSDPEVAKRQVEALEEIINRNNNLDSADNSKQSDGNVVDESMNVHRTR